MGNIQYVEKRRYRNSVAPIFYDYPRAERRRGSQGIGATEFRIKTIVGLISTLCYGVLGKPITTKRTVATCEVGGGVEFTVFFLSLQFRFTCLLKATSYPTNSPL